MKPGARHKAFHTLLHSAEKRYATSGNKWQLETFRVRGDLIVAVLDNIGALQTVVECKICLDVML